MELAMCLWSVDYYNNGLDYNSDGDETNDASNDENASTCNNASNHDTDNTLNWW